MNFSSCQIHLLLDFLQLHQMLLLQLVPFLQIYRTIQVFLALLASQAGLAVMSQRDFPLSDFIEHYEEDVPHHCLGRQVKDGDVYAC